jgi:hypothetical protein
LHSVEITLIAVTVTVLSGGIAALTPPVAGVALGGAVIVPVTSTHWFWNLLKAIDSAPTTKYSFS